MLSGCLTSHWACPAVRLRCSEFMLYWAGAFIQSDLYFWGKAGSHSFWGDWELRALLHEPIGDITLETAGFELMVFQSWPQHFNQIFTHLFLALSIFLDGRNVWESPASVAACHACTLIPGSWYIIQACAGPASELLLSEKTETWILLMTPTGNMPYLSKGWS